MRKSITATLLAVIVTTAALFVLDAFRGDQEAYQMIHPAVEVSQGR